MKYGPAQFGNTRMLFATYSKSQLGLGVAVGPLGVGVAGRRVGVDVTGLLVGVGGAVVGVGVSVTSGVGVTVGVSVGMGVGVNTGVAVCVEVGVKVGLGVLVGVGVEVGGPMNEAKEQPSKLTVNRILTTPAIRAIAGLVRVILKSVDLLSATDCLHWIP